MATFEDFFFGANFALWEEAIADVLQSVEDQREAALDAVYLSKALIAELAERYGTLVGAKPDPKWQLEVFREHLQEVIQAYLMMSSTKAGVQQVVAATTQIPPVLRPIGLLQRWLLGFQYLPNRFFTDLDGFITAEVDNLYTITPENNLLVLRVNGVEQSIALPTGQLSAKQVIDAINSVLIGAKAFPFGKRFGIETIETDVGGSIQVKVESTADTFFGLDNTRRDNAPVAGGTGVLPFGWRLTGSYVPPPPLVPEDPIPFGTNSQPISFDGALFGVGQAKVVGTMESPFIGLLKPVFLTNGSFENGFTEWDVSDGPDFFISAVKSRSGSKSLAVVTRTNTVVDVNGKKTVEPVEDTIKTFPKFIQEGCTIFVDGFHQAKTPGTIYTSPASPPSVYEWTVSNAVFGYMDQQFAQDPVVSDPDAPTILVTDTSVDFIEKGVKVGMAIHVVNGGNAFDGVIKGVSTHQLFVDQWRNGPNGGPTAAHISSVAPAGSGVTYTLTSLQDPAKNFTALGVQTGIDYRTQDKLRIDETISHFGQITTERQIVRDLLTVSTTTNPNDTLTPLGGWGASPTPNSATLGTSGSPYSVYIRPPDGTQYAIFHTLNEIPDFSDNFAHISASFRYVINFYGFDGRLVHEEHRFFRPQPGDDYEEFTFDTIVPLGAETVQLAITVGPDDQITESVNADLDVSVFLSQKKIVPDSESLVVVANGTVLSRGPAPKYDYDIDYVNGAITFHSNGPAGTPRPPVGASLVNGAEVRVTYQYEPKGGALVSIDDIQFRCEERDLPTELHVAVDGKMQKVVFKDPRARAQGVIVYSGTPQDAFGVRIGDEDYEFDLGSHDSGTINYSGFPNDGDTVTIGGATYEFDDDCVVAPGNIVVLIDLSLDQTFQNLTSAINATSSIVTADINTGTNVITITANDIGAQNPRVLFYKLGTGFTLTPSTAGTGTISNSGITVTGVATLFTTEVEAGDVIVASGQARTVVQVFSNTSLATDTAFSPALVGATFAIFPGLTGGGFSDVTPGRIPVFITTEDGTWQNLVEAINAKSTSVFAEFDSMAKTVTVKALEPGIEGNNIQFSIILPFLAIPPYVLYAPTQPTVASGFLAGGTDVHAGGHIEYTGQPADGDTVTVGGVIYEFDSDGITQTALVARTGTVTTTGKNVVGTGTFFTTELFEGNTISVGGQQRQVVTITDDTHLVVDTPFSPDLVGSAYFLVVLTTSPIPIGLTADETYASLVTKLNTDGTVTAVQDTVNGRVNMTAVVEGSAGNTIPFSGTITNANLIPTGGFLSGAVDGDFADDNAPTCDEVKDYINARTTGLTASCDTDGHLVLTCDTVGFKSCIVVGHGSANGILGFENDKGKTNNEAVTRPAWRINVGRPSLGGGMLMSGELAAVVTYFDSEAGSMSMDGNLQTVLTPPSNTVGLLDPVVNDSVDNAGNDKIGIEGFIWSATADAQSRIPIALTMKKLTVRLSTALAGSETLAIELYKNGSPTGLIASFNSGTGTIVTGTGSISVADGDILHLFATLGGGLTSSLIRSFVMSYEVS